MIWKICLILACQINLIEVGLTFVYLRFSQYGSPCYGLFIFRLYSSLGFCVVNSMAIQRCGAPLRGEHGQSVKKGLCPFMEVFLEVRYPPGITQEDSETDQDPASVIAGPRVALCYIEPKTYIPYSGSSQIMLSHIIPCKLPTSVQCDIANYKMEKGAQITKCHLPRDPQNRLTSSPPLSDSQ